MITININDIPRDLPGYLQRLQASETVLILQDNQPVAELKPLSVVSASETLRPFGLCAGKFIVPADFDTALPDAVISDFEGV